MTNKKQQPIQPVVKPFLKGNPTDESTWKSAAGFFGVLVLIAFMSFLVSSMLNLDNTVLRILLNAAVEVLILMILYSNASGRGSDAVARGEIMYQKQEKGWEVAASEKAMCFHPAKGFLIGLLGTLPLLICAILLAVMTHRQETGIGALPSWLSIYERRTEIGDALVAYTTKTGMGFEDILRLIVRVVLMPFVAMVGAENKDALLLVERLSPLLICLPSIAYGCGYLRGRQLRTQVHTEIAQNNKKRAKKERKARAARRKMTQSRGPEQLN